MSLKIKICYREDLYGDLVRLEKIEKGDWIDLYSAIDIELKKGQYELIPLGVAIELPEGFEAHIATRSSTYNTWGVLMANSHGIIDESYKGNDDIWRFPALAMRDTTIHKGDKICQFRIVEKMGKVEFEEVQKLSSQNRGGIGSTGRQ